MTRTEFEQLIPALRDVDGLTWRIVQDAMATAMRSLRRELHIDSKIGVAETAKDMPAEVQACLERTAAVSAAATLLPTLDLTYTPEGFAVRRNDQLTPASTERVHALMRQLREQEAVLWSEAVMALLRAGDGFLKTGQRQQIARRFNFCPAVCENFGLQPSDLTDTDAAGGWTMAAFRAAAPLLQRAHDALVIVYFGPTLCLYLRDAWIEGYADTMSEDPADYEDDADAQFLIRLKIAVRTAARAELVIAQAYGRQASRLREGYGTQASRLREGYGTQASRLREGNGYAAIPPSVDAKLTRALRSLHEASVAIGEEDMQRILESTPLWRHLNGADRAFSNETGSGMFFFS